MAHEIATAAMSASVGFRPTQGYHFMTRIAVDMHSFNLPRARAACSEVGRELDWDSLGSRRLETATFLSILRSRLVVLYTSQNRAREGSGSGLRSLHMMLLLGVIRSFFQAFIDGGCHQFAS